MTLRMRAARFVSQLDVEPAPRLLAAIVEMRDRRDRLGRAHR